LEIADSNVTDELIPRRSHINNRARRQRRSRI